jgi:Na+-driven multidrug efflux pump
LITATFSLSHPIFPLITYTALLITLRGTQNPSRNFFTKKFAKPLAVMENWDTIFNIQLLKFAGKNGVAAYGVMMYVSMIFSATFIGYSIGAAPVIAYHDGARNHDELKRLLKKSLRLLGVSGIVMVTAAQLLTVPLAQIFVGYDKELVDLTVSGFRIFAIAFPFMGFAIFGSGFFTALNDGLTSALISFLRTLVFQVSAVLLLPMIWKIDGIWIFIVVAEVMAVVFTVVFLIVK